MRHETKEIKASFTTLCNRAGPHLVSDRPLIFREISFSWGLQGVFRRGNVLQTSVDGWAGSDVS